jgi:hypothetical protein
MYINICISDINVYMYTCPHLHKYIHIYVEREHGWNSDLLKWTKRRWRGKGNGREWIILKYIASVWEDSMMKCTENCWLIREQGDRERVSNREG